jgi:xanthine dehydrogenase YagT iron-sulfur-binding subunit
MAEFDPNRRKFIKNTAVTSGAIAAARLSPEIDAKTVIQASQTTTPSKVNVLLRVNGSEHQLLLDPRTSLLDALRERLHLTGTKKGCDQGQCGACTVIVDGRRITSCLTLAVMQEGHDIMTIEGLGTPNNLHPMQSAFIKHDGYQCGFCTPGQICSAVAMLNEVKAGIPSHVTADLTQQPEMNIIEFRERMSGNLCRCGAYSNIQEAISEVAGTHS